VSPEGVCEEEGLFLGGWLWSVVVTGSAGLEVCREGSASFEGRISSTSSALSAVRKSFQLRGISVIEGGNTGKKSSLFFGSGQNFWAPSAFLSVGKGSETD
jgi:hypothetical protein